MKTSPTIACISLKSACLAALLRPALTALLLAPLADVLPAADAVANDATPSEILAPDELALVRELATATLETCGVAPGAIAHGKTNTLGFRAITPGRTTGSGRSLPQV